MKKFLVLYLFLVPYFALAQKHFEVYGGYQFSKPKTIFSNIDGGFSPNAGIGVLGDIKQRTKWMIGLQMFTFSEKTESDLTWGTEHNGQGGHSGIPDPNLPDKLKFKTTHLHLTLPFSIRQYLVDQKTKLFVQPSVGPSLYLTSKRTVTYVYPDEDTETEKFYDKFGNRKMNLQCALSIGLEFQLSQKVKIMVIPYGCLHFFSTAKGGNNQNRFYGYGLRTGVQFGI